VQLVVDVVPVGDYFEFEGGAGGGDIAVGSGFVAEETNIGRRGSSNEWRSPSVKVFFARPEDGRFIPSSTGPSWLASWLVSTSRTRLRKGVVRSVQSRLPPRSIPNGESDRSQFNVQRSWPPTFGQAHTSKLSDSNKPPPTQQCSLPHSKRWLVDRATLKHARSDDLRYVDDPTHLPLLAIFFANGTS
jgi:hypothetical protein